MSNKESPSKKASNDKVFEEVMAKHEKSKEKLVNLIASTEAMSDTIKDQIAHTESAMFNIDPAEGGTSPVIAQDAGTDATTPDTPDVSTGPDNVGGGDKPLENVDIPIAAARTGRSRIPIPPQTPKQEPPVETIDMTSSPFARAMAADAAKKAEAKEDDTRKIFKVHGNVVSFTPSETIPEEKFKSVVDNMIKTGPIDEAEFVEPMRLIANTETTSDTGHESRKKKPLTFRVAARRVGAGVAIGTIGVAVLFGIKYAIVGFIGKK